MSPAPSNPRNSICLLCSKPIRHGEGVSIQHGTLVHLGCMSAETPLRRSATVCSARGTRQPPR